MPHRRVEPFCQALSAKPELGSFVQSLRFTERRQEVCSIIDILEQTPNLLRLFTAGLTSEDIKAMGPHFPAGLQLFGSDSLSHSSSRAFTPKQVAVWFGQLQQLQQLYLAEDLRISDKGTVETVISLPCLREIEIQCVAKQSAGLLRCLSPLRYGPGHKCTHVLTDLLCRLPHLSSLTIGFYPPQLAAFVKKNGSHLLVLSIPNFQPPFALSDVPMLESLIIGDHANYMFNKRYHVQGDNLDMSWSLIKPKKDHHSLCSITVSSGLRLKDVKSVSNSPSFSFS